MIEGVEEHINGVPLDQTLFCKICSHCGAALLPSEDLFFCCDLGTNKLQHVPALSQHWLEIYQKPEFSKYSKSLNNLFAFTAIGAKAQG